MSSDVYLNMKNFKTGDITNYGRFIRYTMAGNYIIENSGVVGKYQNVFKVNAKSEEGVQMLTKYPIR